MDLKQHLVEVDERLIEKDQQNQNWAKNFANQFGVKEVENASAPVTDTKTVDEKEEHKFKYNEPPKYEGGKNVMDAIDAKMEELNKKFLDKFGDDEGEKTDLSSLGDIIMDKDNQDSPDDKKTNLLQGLNARLNELKDEQKNAK
eukprot:UN02057